MSLYNISQIIEQYFSLSDHSFRFRENIEFYFYFIGKMVQKSNSLVAFVKNIYYDEYKWAVVKSASLFILGVRIAKECIGLELMPAIPH
ncbi:uncharacterized protein LOC129767392 [Toxorhynchites rutilus septentrionalis]|uniref:uncharacterized protein LOC129767392 n=1 Tax=Toxorhynchites rutilus septentrionalis TaxID=329112 RepID=UPI00247899D7|nr:uncharacterized protein LOC129767392 [Toxorhynchites rutilus septentrionalis]